MTSDISDWIKVKVVAAIGLGASAISVESLDAWLGIAIKVGQVGALVATILFTLAKWRAARKRNRDK